MASLFRPRCQHSCSQTHRRHAYTCVLAHELCEHTHSFLQKKWKEAPPNFYVIVEFYPKPNIIPTLWDTGSHETQRMFNFTHTKYWFSFTWLLILGIREQNELSALWFLHVCEVQLHREYIVTCLIVSQIFSLMQTS